MLIYAGMFRTTVRQVSAGSRVQDLGRDTLRGLKSGLCNP